MAAWRPSSAPPPNPWRHARHGEPIALTAAEIRRPFNAPFIHPLRAKLRAIGDIQHWSNWRHHQGQARHSHYRPRLTAELGP